MPFKKWKSAVILQAAFPPSCPLSINLFLTLLLVLPVLCRWQIAFSLAVYMAYRSVRLTVQKQKIWLFKSRALRTVVILRMRWREGLSRSVDTNAVSVCDYRTPCPQWHGAPLLIDCDCPLYIPGALKHKPRLCLATPPSPPSYPHLHSPSPLNHSYVTASAELADRLWSEIPVKVTCPYFVITNTAKSLNLQEPPPRLLCQCLF